MEILSADTDCVHEVMVQLVEIGVEQPVMHKSVEEIEGDIFGDHQKDKLEEEGRRIREIFKLETELNSFVNPEV